MDVLARVRRTIQARDLAPRGARVVVALSGGSDSVALAHLLVELADAGELDVAGFAHFNHQLRESAAADERFCEAVAASLGRRLLTGRGDVAARARQERRSIEAAARAARYELFEQALTEFPADFVALGHTRDDQAETFLLRLIRGSGGPGLGGMHPRRGPFIRPLLDCRRADLRRYLDARSLTYVTDDSNDDVAIPRNRVRAELLPLLERRFNPSVVDALAHEADLARDEWQWLDDAADALARSICHREGSVWRIDAARLNAAPIPLARAVVHRAMSQAAKGRTVAFLHVEAALEVSRGGPAIDAPSQHVDRVGDFLVLTSRPEGTTGRWSSSAPANFFRYPLSIPGEVALVSSGRILSAEPLRGLIRADLMQHGGTHWRQGQAGGRS